MHDMKCGNPSPMGVKKKKGKINFNSELGSMDLGEFHKENNI